MSRTRFLTLIAAIPALSLTLVAADYALDLLSPGQIFNASNGVSVVPVPSRVCIVAKEPKLGFDKTWLGELVGAKQPTYSTTNKTEISELMERLRKDDNRHRIENVSRVSGITYHCLLFRDSDKTVMHFRVFTPASSNRVACAIWPQSDTGFIYYNAELSPWILERVKKGDSK